MTDTTQAREEFMKKAGKLLVEKGIRKDVIEAVYEAGFVDGKAAALKAVLKKREAKND